MIEPYTDEAVSSWVRRMELRGLLPPGFNEAPSDDLAPSPQLIAAARNLRDAVVGIVLRRAEELAQLTEDLQRSNKELEAFSYSVSHDLRAPFRHIVGFSELLREREKNLDQKSRHYLDTIAESAVAAGRLVDDLLNFSHLGRTELALKNVDMNKVVNEVRQSLALAAKGRRIVWNVEELPSAWGDATLLRQVWHNLVENAVKYTRPKEEAVISIRGWREGEETIYAIGDNGVGFDMAYIDKLFGVFQRLQRVEDFEGTGIGLALSRRVIERLFTEHGLELDFDIFEEMTPPDPSKRHAVYHAMDLNFRLKPKKIIYFRRR